jgi:hypothetical protein
VASRSRSHPATQAHRGSQKSAGQWSTDTRKGGRYEHLSCFTSASFPVKPTELPEDPIIKPEGVAAPLSTATITEEWTVFVSQLPQGTHTATHPIIPSIGRPAAARVHGTTRAPSIYVANKTMPSSNEHEPATSTPSASAAVPTPFTFHVPMRRPLKSKTMGTAVSESRPVKTLPVLSRQV